MGADIHATIEIRDDAGHWHAVYDTGIFWSAWWQSRFMQGRDKFSEDPYGLSALRWRDYNAFGFLSAVRGENNLAAHSIGTTDGWARTSGSDDDGHGGYGWPKDVSAVAQDSEDNVDYHSHGWMTLGDLRKLDAELASVPEPEDSDSDLAWCLASARAFCSRALHALTSLLGDTEHPPLVGHTFTVLPDDEGYDDPNFDVCAGKGHGALRSHMVMRDKRIGDYDPEHVRILVCYDN